MRLVRKWAALFLLAASVFSAGGWVAHQKLESVRAAEEKGRRLRGRQAAWGQMKRDLSQEIRRFDGQAGVVVEDLKTGWRLVHQADRSFPAASVIKVPMMTGCFQAAEEGRLDLNSHVAIRSSDKVSGSGVLKAMPGKRSVPASRLIEWMITESDNTATNALISRLGMDYFNRHFRRLGLEDTRLSRKMMDFSQRKRGVENTTTAGDMAEVLRKIYRADSVRPAVSRSCLGLLKRQRTRDRIPAQLPRGTPVAHKTGLERSVCHDAGIIFTRKGDLLICVLTQRKGKKGSQPAKRFIARLAERTYRYLGEAP